MSPISDTIDRNYSSRLLRSTASVTHQRAYPIHEAPGTAGSGDGQMYASLPSLRGEAVSRFEPMTTRSQCSNLTVASRPALSASVTHRHPLMQELQYTQLLRILSRQMQRFHYRPSTFIRANQINGLLSRFTATLAPPGVSPVQFLPEPLVGQLIRRTLENFPVELMFAPRHNNPVLIVPSIMVESINLTVTAPTSLIPSDPVMGYKATMIPKIEDTTAEIWSSWLGISHESNIDLSMIPESFLNQPIRPPMKILFWNCKGAGNAPFLKAITDLIHQHNPSMLVLMETVISGAGASVVIEQLGFSGNFCLDPQGVSGGIWILWKMEDLEVHATYSGGEEIHAVIQMHPSKPSWIPSSASEGTSSQLYDEFQSSDKSGGLLDHKYIRTSKREKQEDHIKELFLKAHVQKLLMAHHPNYYCSMLLSRKRNSKAMKKKGHENSSRTLLMRLVKVIQGCKADEDLATPPTRDGLVSDSVLLD